MIEVNYSKPTIIKTILELQKICKCDIETNQEKLGGNGIVLQCDETAISRKGRILVPTTSNECTKKTKWLLGIIDEKDKDKFVLILFENRTFENIYGVFKKFVNERSVMKTDGYPTYPNVMQKMNYIHSVVNHTLGFKNEKGEHTNNIENLWSCLKSDITRRHGVLRKNLDMFLSEWSWKRINVKNKNKEYILRAFGRFFISPLDWKIIAINN